MKTAINELRMYLSQKLLTWAMHLAPNNAEGETFVRAGVGYFEKVIINKMFNNNTNNGE